jgi:DNA gyrase subunit B
MLQSVEVGTLITALGCGIGKEEFDATKLRYHRIIIMTDADVDGSHIRTLLLTFFYRQMPELLERGHIYIAQPPLYKLKRGKKEYYVKDDAELNAIVLSSAIDGAELHARADAAPIGPETLDTLAREHMQVKAIIDRWGRRYDPDVLGALIWQPAVEEAQLESPAAMQAWCKSLEQRLMSGDGTRAKYTVAYETGDDENESTIEVTREHHGGRNVKLIHASFFRSPEYQRIAAIGTKFRDLLGPGAWVVRGDDRQDIATVPEAIEWLMARAKQGQTIQRYKGLGEMNPEQLWETTLDVNARSLLRVKVSELDEADDLFTKLMGDVVEPRRDFIRENALSVANLDV